MTGFGLLFMVAALVHDFWGPPQPTSRMLWPYALIALSFYVGVASGFGLQSTLSPC
mgnify:CR=1 FL=1